MLHMFMSLALDKLAQSVQTQELRAMALLVVVAGEGSVPAEKGSLQMCDTWNFIMVNLVRDDSIGFVI